MIFIIKWENRSFLRGWHLLTFFLVAVISTKVNRCTIYIHLKRRISHANMCTHLKKLNFLVFHIEKLGIWRILLVIITIKNKFSKLSTELSYLKMPENYVLIRKINCNKFSKLASKNWYKNLKKNYLISFTINFSFLKARKITYFTDVKLIFLLSSVTCVCIYIYM